MAKMGRPLKFKNAEELDKRIDEFYEYCEAKGEPLTFERLAVFLNCERTTIYKYEQRDEFSDSIKRARDMILADLMARGLTNEINSTF